MPAGEIAGEAIGAVARIVGRLIVEVVFELLVRGTGYAVLRSLRPSREPGETASALVGLVVWAGVIAACVWLYHAAA